MDTSVAVYVYHRSALAKQARAREIFVRDAGELIVSSQILSEFYWVTTRKLQPPLPPTLALEATARLATLPIVPMNRTLAMAAAELADEIGISLWDGQVVEAAASDGCDAVLTEDLNAGQIIRGVEGVNPFEDVN